MGDYLFPAGSIFGPNCPIVIALDPEVEVASAFDHFVVSFFVVIELFQVCDVPENLAALYRYEHVY